MSDNEKRFNPKKRHDLLKEERHERWNPPHFLRRFDIQPGQAALDLGCGPGFWTLPLADIVGPTGRVWALDVSQEMLDTLAQREPPAPVVPVLSELPEIGLETAVSDFVWAAFVYHEVEGDGLAAEMFRVTRPGGQVAILEWRPDDPEQSRPPKHHRVWPAQVKQALQEAGFSQVAEMWRDAEAYLITAQKENGDG
ncbi:MAG: class I SAM-dependent methyltransferase [Chloroflexota bacterium]